MDSSLIIPVIDLAKVNVNLSENEIESETFQSIGNDLVKALTQVGFFYITNHGVQTEEINACSEAGKQFFNLADEVKLSRIQNISEGVCGYLPVPGVHEEDTPNEKFDLSKPADHKEALIICHRCKPSVWPDEELSQLKKSTMSIISRAQDLTRRLLLLIGYGLKPDDPTCFQEGYKDCGTLRNVSQIKFVRYLGTTEAEVEKGGMRCGEHTDVGLITLLFLDSTPGLQIFNRQGNYQDVDFLEDTILVNIGDLFQRWTCDVLHSAKHRVIYRPDTFNRDRYSLIYFAVPDSEAVIDPVIEPFNKYPSIRTIDYFNRRKNEILIEGKGIASELKIPK